MNGKKDLFLLLSFYRRRSLMETFLEGYFCNLAIIFNEPVPELFTVDILLNGRYGGFKFL